MATGADLLTAMADVDDNFDATTHATAGLRWLNWAQDLMEREAAKRTRLFQTATTVATVASTETTARPSGLLRLDALIMLDDNSRPYYEMEPVKRMGSQRTDGFITPYFVQSIAAGSGRPSTYYMDSANFYWGPVDPDGVYTVRVLGMISKADITSPGTFAYPDDLIPILAGIALEPFRLRVEDVTQEVEAFALKRLGSYLDSVEGEWKHGAYQPAYHYYHMV